MIRPKPPRPPAAAKRLPPAATLETGLQDQLKALAAALSPPDAPAGEPAKAAAAPEAPRRSVFAPDPVRQRTYFDLRSPSAGEGPRRALPPAPGIAPPAGADDSRVVVPVRHPPLPARAAQVGLDTGEEDARSRGLDARTLSAATLVGVGIGFAALTLMGHLFPSVDAARFSLAGIVPMSAPAPELPPEAPDAAVAESVAAAPPPVKDQERVTAEVVHVPGDPVEGRTEADAFPAAREVVAPPPPPPAPQVDTVVASPPPRTVQPAPRSAPAERAVPEATDLLAYAPVVPRSFPPERARDDGPARDAGPGSARVTTAVNMRARPDNGAAVVAVLAPGTVVRIEACDFWCTVVAGDRRGYVYRKFVGR